MFKFKTRLKKMIAIVIAVFTLGILVTIPARGDDALVLEYLKQIRDYTYNTAKYTYEIKAHTKALLVILNSWMMPDDSDTSADFQSKFAEATNTVITNYATQISLQSQLMTAFYGDSVTTTSVPYANDMTFGTLIGQPYFSKDPRKKDHPEINPAFNYLKNIAGLNIKHIPPADSWTGSEEDKQKYMDFYTTVTSIQTFNAYLISQFYADNANSGTLTQQQNDLMQQASGSDWFSQVGSENIGIVFRQMLMYNSQIYVLLTQLLQSQKQMVAELAMTNTLFVIGNQFTENNLLSKATTGE